MQHTERQGPLGARPIPAMALGTMMFGTTVDAATSFAILDRYVDAGGTLLDTANCYAFWVSGGTGHESEELIGTWLRSRRIRDRMTIATKLGAAPARPNEPYDAHNREGLSPDVIEREVTGSLQRLGIEHIDLLYAHADDRQTRLDDTMRAFDAETRTGRVGMLGASNYTAWRFALAQQCADAHGLARFSAIQLRHTYLTPAPLRGPVTDEIQLPLTAEVVDLATSDGRLALLAYSPLIGGAYTRPTRPVPAVYDTDAAPHRLRAVREVAASRGATANQVVLAWMLAGDPPVLPILGVSSVEQLDDCLRALDLELTPENLERLDRA